MKFLGIERQILGINTYEIFGYRKANSGYKNKIQRPIRRVLTTIRSRLLHLVKGELQEQIHEVLCCGCKRP